MGDIKSDLKSVEIKTSKLIIISTYLSKSYEDLTAVTRYESHSQIITKTTAKTCSRHVVNTT